MLVKIRKCGKCKHPADDHSAYRERCLHKKCRCNRGNDPEHATGRELYMVSAVHRLNAIERDNDGDNLAEVQEASDV